ncbi:MAG: hypothetical protein KDK91_25745, partial [Gammaproteobacteria bacterium]|nr:hypothetical protein [Gammaproteobacteria bacterium]
WVTAGSEGATPEAVHGDFEEFGPATRDVGAALLTPGLCRQPRHPIELMARSGARGNPQRGA